MIRTATTLLLVALASSFAATAQTVYKWVDDKGVTHYTETPPPADTKAQKLEVKPPPPSARRPVDDPSSWKGQARELELQRKEREAAASKAEAASTDQARRCRSARIREDQLVHVEQLYHYDEKGERHYLTDDERALELDQARKFIARSC